MHPLAHGPPLRSLIERVDARPGGVRWRSQVSWRLA